MIVQVARLRVEPGKAESAESEARVMAQAVQDAEPGVVTYLIYRSATDPNELVFFEIFADQEAYDAHHEATPHFSHWRSLFGEVFTEGALEVEQLIPLCGYSRAPL